MTVTLLMASHFSAALTSCSKARASEMMATPRTFNLSESKRTEAGVSPNCHCELDRVFDTFNSTPKKKNMVDIAKLIDRVTYLEYYKKYQIDQFLQEVFEKAPAQMVNVDEAIQKLFSGVKPPAQESFVGVNANETATGGAVAISLLQVLASVGNSVPEVKAIADAYVVRLKIDGRSGEKGMEFGQQKAISVETNKLAGSKFNMGLSYAACGKGSAMLAFGAEFGCSFEDKFSATFEERLRHGVYLGGTVSDSSFLGNILPEGNLYFRVEF
jgi:hypothetical protein